MSLRGKKHCACVITQPHSYEGLERIVKILEMLDNNRTEWARLVIAASTSLRVFDMIEVGPSINTEDHLLPVFQDEFGTLLHPSWTHQRQVVYEKLKDLLDGPGLSQGIDAKLRDIIAYEESKVRKGGPLEFLLADLRILPGGA